MIRYKRNYSSRHQPRSPWVSLGVALVLVGIAALKAWWDRSHVPFNPAQRPPFGENLPDTVAARVLWVSDGDTFEARVEVKPGLRIRTRVRLRGVDAPELHAKCEAERVGAQVAKRALQAILADGGVTLHALSEDKYGRLLATVATRKTPDVARVLIAKGVARPYYGGHRDGWCD
jgi:endonuclease YncB( thermonuclease family)